MDHEDAQVGGETRDPTEGLTIRWAGNGQRLVNLSAEKLRVVRRDLRGWTQAELQRRAGLADRYVAHAEAEDGWRRLTTVLRLAKALGVPPLELQADGTE